MSNDILVPNIGDFNNVEIIEVLIKEGQEIEKGDTVITLESDKSSVEVPSSISGTVKVVHIKIGDKVSEGSLVASLEGTIESGKINLPGSESKKNIENKDKVDELRNSIITQSPTNVIEEKTVSAQSVVFSNNGVGVSGASPKIMKFARELGISVNDISGSGRQGRVLEQDIKNYVSQNLNKNKIKENDTLSSKTEKVDSDPLPYQHNEFGMLMFKQFLELKKCPVHT